MTLGSETSNKGVVPRIVFEKYLNKRWLSESKTRLNRFGLLILMSSSSFIGYFVIC